MPTPLFKKGEAPKAGVRSSTSSALVRSIRQAMKPYSVELVERAMAQALSGDTAAIVACLNLYGAALTAHAAELNLKIARPTRKPASKAAQADAA